jgi:microsomal dipeptidase-like Zn-dependent dipeptidase
MMLNKYNCQRFWYADNLPQQPNDVTNDSFITKALPERGYSKKDIRKIWEVTF